MNPDLLSKMININVIKPGTEIAILRYGVSMDGGKTATHLMRVFSAEDKDGNQKASTVQANHIVEVYECGVNAKGNAYMKATSTVDGKGYLLYSKDVILIDFMMPEKLANVYGYLPDGTKKKQGKKRGRKPKIRE